LLKYIHTAILSRVLDKHVSSVYYFI